MIEGLTTQVLIGFASLCATMIAAWVKITSRITRTEAQMESFKIDLQQKFEHMERSYHQQTKNLMTVIEELNREFKEERRRTQEQHERLLVELTKLSTEARVRHEQHS
jgi:hypothetical protein